MGEQRTTEVLQQWIDKLANGDSVKSVIRSLLDKAARRLHQLCATFLHRSYPRLTRPPLNLQSEEMLSAVVERLLKALRAARPTKVRQFFALAGQHIRWGLNDLARRLDERPRQMCVEGDVMLSPESNGSSLSIDGRRMIEAIEGLPEEEREAFDLVRIQGLSNVEAAEILGVSPKTMKRRLDGSLRLLAERLSDLVPAEAANAT